MSLIITRALVIITALVSIIIVALSGRKSNTVKEQHKHLEKWAIIGREFIEFDEDELRWRAGK